MWLGSMVWFTRLPTERVLLGFTAVSMGSGVDLEKRTSLIPLFASNHPNLLPFLSSSPDLHTYLTPLTFSLFVSISRTFKLTTDDRMALQADGSSCCTYTIMPIQ